MNGDQSLNTSTRTTMALNPPGKRMTDVLALDFAFSQRPLLTADDFIKALKQRGIAVDRKVLSTFHREGLLLPVFRLAKDVRQANKRDKQPTSYPGRSLIHYDVRSTTALKSHLAAGRLYDCRLTPYKPWARFDISFNSVITSTSEHLYSPYQLLIAPIIDEMRGWLDKLGSRKIKPRLPNWWRGRFDYEIHRNDRDVVLLSALESAFRPLLVGTLSLPVIMDGKDAWQEYQRKFDPSAMLQWLGATADDIRLAAHCLILNANSYDPMVKWLDLTRLIDPRKWNDLEDNALIAFDIRIAAETLLLFYDRLEVAGAAPELDPSANGVLIDRYRLIKKGVNLDTALAAFGLSPHPSVVMVVEGDTEHDIYIRPVLDLVGVVGVGTDIKIFNAGSIDQNIGPLAQYIATPDLGKVMQWGVLIERPITHLVVAFDAEKKYKDASGIDQEKAVWVKRLREAIPPDLMNDPNLTAPIDGLLNNVIEIHTWGHVFEFAHFDNQELANAIQTACAAHHVTPGSLTIAEIQKIRDSQAPNIERIWKNPRNNWQRGISKRDLAEALWPVLRAKILSALAAGTEDSIPIVRVAKRVKDLARQAQQFPVIVGTPPAS